MKRNQKPDRSGRAEELYIAERTESVQAGSGDELVLACRTGGVRALPAEQAGLLRYLERWRTLEEHGEALEKARVSFPGSGTALTSLVRQGLLWSKSDFLAEARSRIRTKPPEGGITTTVWCTAGRPGSLAASFAAYARLAADAGRSGRLLVLDDSRDETSRAANLRALRATRRDIAGSSLAIGHCGPEEKAALVARLERRAELLGCSPGTVAFALGNPFGFEFGAGANRNAALLLTRGELICAVDDDVYPDIAPSPEEDGSLSLASDSFPFEVDFFPDRASVERAVRHAPGDFVSFHEKLIGREVAEVLADGRDEKRILLDRCGQGFAFALSQRGGSLLATSTGSFGDSGTRNPRMVFSLAGRSRDRALQSEEAYRSALSSREIHRRVPRVTIAEGSYLQAMCCGLDNRGLLPPFLPVGRGEDGLFAVLLHSCNPTGYIAHLPEGVRHEPPEARRYAEGSISEFRPRLTEFVTRLVEDVGFKPWETAPAARLEEIGRYLAEAGSLPPRAFDDLTRATWLRRAGELLGSHELALRRNAHEPSFWADDVERHMDEIRSYVCRPGRLVPSELDDAADPDTSLETFRRILRSFGELLAVWPALTVEPIESESPNGLDDLVAAIE